MTNKGDRQVDLPRAREGKPNTVVEKAGFCFCFFLLLLQSSKLRTPESYGTFQSFHPVS